MRNLIKSYIKDENALDDTVTKAMFIVGGVVVGAAVIWFIYNMVAGQAENASETLEGASNPGAGNEFSADNMFGG